MGTCPPGLDTHGNPPRPGVDIHANHDRVRAARTDLDKFSYFGKIRMMREREAIGGFAALAHPLRMRAFRLLVASGSDGVSAGEVASSLGCPPSTLSQHLARLERSGLLTARRDQQRIFYAVDVEGVSALMAFLVEECCNGRPELCGYASSRNARIREE